MANSLMLMHAIQKIEPNHQCFKTNHDYYQMKFVLNKSVYVWLVRLWLDAANKITMTSTKYGHQILLNKMCVCVCEGGE